MSNFDFYKRQGKLLHGMIVSSGYSIYSFANKVGYSKSGMYDIVNGKRSILTLEMSSFVKIAEMLGYDSLDKFSKDLSLEILK